MATLEFLMNPDDGITRPVLRDLLKVFGVERSKQAFKEELQLALRYLPLTEVMEEVQELKKNTTLFGHTYVSHIGQDNYVMELLAFSAKVPSSELTSIVEETRSMPRSDLLDPSSISDLLDTSEDLSKDSDDQVVYSLSEEVVRKDLFKELPDTVDGGLSASIFNVVDGMKIDREVSEVKVLYRGKSCREQSGEKERCKNPDPKLPNQGSLSGKGGRDLILVQMKVEVVQRILFPKSKKKLRQFLGIIERKTIYQLLLRGGNYNGCFIMVSQD
jgi:hypothetical protein